MPRYFANAPSIFGAREKSGVDDGDFKAPALFYIWAHTRTYNSLESFISSSGSLSRGNINKNISHKTRRHGHFDIFSGKSPS